MNHLLPDVPLPVVIAHFFALGALFGPPVVRRVRRWQFKKHLAESSSPMSTFRSGKLRQLGSIVIPSGSPFKSR